MNVQEPTKWITGDEFGAERRRLLLAGYKDDSPEMERLWSQVRERDEFLWKRYAEPLIETHYGEWAAISIQGEVLLEQTASQAITAATDQFGPGNFTYGKLAEFRGHNLSRC